FFCQPLDGLRVLGDVFAKSVYYCLAIPIPVELSSRFRFTLDKRIQSEFATSLICETFVGFCRLKWRSAGVEVFSANVERLVDVAQIMREENNGDGFGNGSAIGLWLLALQHANA